MKQIQVFEELAEEYDKWFEKNKFAYQSELKALKKFIPRSGRGLEIGVGTGRFAVPFEIKEGIEPAEAMAKIARSRGIKVCKQSAEKLLFAGQSFDFVTIVTTICFLSRPYKALLEARRILKPKGHLIIGLIDKAGKLGKYYESKRKENEFYRHAKFYSTEQILKWLKKLNFENIQTRQTLFKLPKKMTEVEPVKKGYRKGGFVVISAEKSKKA